LLLQKRNQPRPDRAIAPTAARSFLHLSDSGFCDLRWQKSVDAVRPQSDTTDFKGPWKTRFFARAFSIIRRQSDRASGGVILARSFDGSARGTGDPPDCCSIFTTPRDLFHKRGREGLGLLRGGSSRGRGTALFRIMRLLTFLGRPPTQRVGPRHVHGTAGRHALRPRAQPIVVRAVQLVSLMFDWRIGRLLWGGLPASDGGQRGDFRMDAG